MKKTNVFYDELHCGWRYFIYNPIKWCKRMIRAMKMAHQRIERGWCMWDVWNMGDWMLDTVPEMLDALGKYGMGYPADFDSRDEWVKWLEEQAQLLRQCREEEQNAANPYYEEVIEKGNFNFKSEYIDAAKRIAEESRNRIRISFSNLSERFLDLWD